MLWLSPSDIKASSPGFLWASPLASEVGGLIRSEAIWYCCVSDLAPLLPTPVGLVTERLALPGAATMRSPSGILPLGAAASEPLLPTQNLVLRGASSGRNVVGVINAVCPGLRPFTSFGAIASEYSNPESDTSCWDVSVLATLEIMSSEVVVTCVFTGSVSTDKLITEVRSKCLRIHYNMNWGVTKVNDTTILQRSFFSLSVTRPRVVIEVQSGVLKH